MKSRKYNQFEDNDNINNNFIDYYNNNKEIKSSKDNNNLKLSSQDDSQIIKSNQNNNSSIQFKNYKELNSNNIEEKNDNNNNEDENINSNDSNVLNYNYLETDKIENGDDEDEVGPGSKSLEDIIHELKAENKELRNDMKKLYFLTQENKNNLIEHIKMLKNENFILKKEKNDLEYCLLSKERKINELTADNEKLVNDNKKNELKYLDEIKELNCQLNNYKLQLNKLKLDYDQLSNDFNYFKKISNE